MSTEKSQVEVDEQDLSERRDWTKLPDELLTLVQSYLHLIRDFNRFRSVCKSWKFAAYPEEHIGYGSQFLIEKGHDQSIVRLFHPLAGETSYCINIPQLRDSSIRSSGTGEGWLLLSRGIDEIFFFRPSPRNPRQLHLPRQFLYDTTDGLTFTSNPDSEDWMVFGNKIFEDGIIFYKFCGGESNWGTVEHDNTGKLVPCYVNPIYVDGKFWCLFSRGELGIFDPNIPNKYKIFRHGPPEIEERCSYEKYLLDFNGEVMSVFVGEMGYPILIFKWDTCDSNWQQVEDLGEHMLFLSETTSFARQAEIEFMKNKIYFPRFHKNYGIYYCLKESSYQIFGNDHHYLSNSRSAFAQASLQLDCCWIEATEAWLPPVRKFRR